MSEPALHLSLVEPDVVEPDPTLDLHAVLRERLRPDWRPGEWLPEIRYFVGNPANPETFVFACKTPGCTRLSISKSTPLCSACTTIRQRLGVDSGPEFMAAWADRNSEDQYIYFGHTALDPCTLVTDGQQCQRKGNKDGLCFGHLKSHRMFGKGLTRQEFAFAGISQAMAALPECAVLGCFQEIAANTTKLCTVHRRHYADEARPGESEQEFAARDIPVTSRGSFSMAALPEDLYTEILYALQRADELGYAVYPASMVSVLNDLRETGAQTLLGISFNQLPRVSRAPHMQSVLSRLQRMVHEASVELVPFDPMTADTWDLKALRFRSERNAYRHSRGMEDADEARSLMSRKPLDFRSLRIEWIKQITKQYFLDVRPTTEKCAQYLKAMVYVSNAVEARADGQDRSTATGRDISLAIDLLRGSSTTSDTQHRYVRYIGHVLAYARSADHLKDVADSFGIGRHHRIRRIESPESKQGRALPNNVVEALIKAIPTFVRKGQSGSSLSTEDISALYRTALLVIMETGRRPTEICSLRVGCVEIVREGEGVLYNLVYDNLKAGRAGRRLPIRSDVASVLLEWEEHRKGLNLDSTVASDWLFPSPSYGRKDGSGHLTSAALRNALTVLAEQAGPLFSNEPDKTAGRGYLPFTGKLDLYAFRHSYAQRHADARVDPDTLRALLDHKSSATTAGYYTVSSERRREAVEKLAPLVVNREGRPAPFSTPEQYEISTVAVPFGNCAEPSNVSAGGQGCPVRFRCGGCSMFRPDPSALPQLETHLADLRSNLATAKALGLAAPWVITETEEEIKAYSGIVKSIKEALDRLPSEDRAAVDEASEVMRKVRANRTLIPIEALRRGPNRG